jgi:hypothetical protein
LNVETGEREKTGLSREISQVSYIFLCPFRNIAGYAIGRTMIF